MELTELKRVQNTKELPGYVNGAVAGDAGESDKPNFFLKIGLAFTKEGAIGKAFSKGGFLGKDGFMDKNGSAIATGATGVLDMVNGIGAASKYNKTADDLLQDAGKSQSNIGGVGYTVQNDINKSAEEAQVDSEAKSSTLGLAAKGAATGAAIASVIPGIGTAVGGIVGGVAGLVGGLFGGAAKKREMKKQLRLAEIKRINKNDFNRSGALTTVLQNDLAETEGDQTQQTLYAAANGKESYSAGGPTSGYNARVSNGEIIANKFTGEMFRVPGIPNNKDGKLAFIRPSDTIISNKYGLSDYVALTGDLEGGEAMQGTIMKALGKRGYKNGKLPGFVNGTSIEDNPYYKDLKARLDFVDYMLNNTSGLFRNGYKNGKLPGYKLGLEEINTIGNLGLGALSMLDSYNKRREPVKNPYTYSNNVYENVALNEMNNLRVNPYPIMPLIYDTMAKGMYAIENAGGLGGGLRNLARLAAITDANNNIAKLLSSIQEKNNDYRQGWAQAALTTGSDDARRRMLSNQWDLDYYSKAHGAREKMADQRRADALTFFQSYLNGVNDINMFKKQMDLYWADYYAKHPEKDPNKKQTVSTIPVVSNSNTHTKGILPDPMKRMYESNKKPNDEFRYKIPKVLSNSYLNNLYKLDPSVINYLSNYGIR